MLLGLSLLLSIGCSPKAIVKPEVVKQYPPAAWIQDCPVPTYISGQDWAYIGEYAKSLQLALEQCNCDKVKLRAWASEKDAPVCKAGAE